MIFDLDNFSTADNEIEKLDDIYSVEHLHKYSFLFKIYLISLEIPQLTM